MPKISSLKNAKEFKLLERDFTKHNLPFFIVIVSKFFETDDEGRLCLLSEKINSNDSFFLGMKVSKRFAKNAVLRNRAKNIIRHLTRNSCNRFKDKIDGYGIIVIPKKSILTAKFSDMQEVFDSIFLKSNI